MSKRKGLNGTLKCLFFSSKTISIGKLENWMPDKLTFYQIWTDDLCHCRTCRRSHCSGVWISSGETAVHLWYFLRCKMQTKRRQLRFDNFMTLWVSSSGTISAPRIPSSPPRMWILPIFGQPPPLLFLSPCSLPYIRAVRWILCNNFIFSRKCFSLHENVQSGLEVRANPFTHLPPFIKAHCEIPWSGLRTLCQ